VLVVAILTSTFAAHGGYASPASFVAGFTPGMWLATALTASGVLAALALPRRARPVAPPDLPAPALAR
jgi:hypothetical protein